MITKTYKTIVVDDEHYGRGLIRHYLTDNDEFELVGSFKNAREAEEFIDQHTVDLIFLDVHMPIKNGMEFLEDNNYNCKIILTTAHQEYAIKAFDFDVADYLLKPILKKRFEDCLKKVKEKLELEQLASNHNVWNSNNSGFIIIKSGYDQHKINIQDIDYIESVGEYIRYHIGKKSYMELNSLTKTDLKLGEEFIRIHRSYLVPKRKVISKKANSVMLKAGIELPIGKTYRKKISSTDLFSQ